MLRILQHFILSTLFALFASHASAMFIQADTPDPTEQGVGTNRYAYSANDPINNFDPLGQAYTNRGHKSPDSVDETNADELRGWADGIAKQEFEDGIFDPLGIFLDDGTFTGVAAHAPSATGLLKPKGVVLWDPSRSPLANETTNLRNSYSDPRAWATGATNAALMAGARIPSATGPVATAKTKGLLQNPFKGKTVKEIADLLLSRGYVAKGPDPISGRGSFHNPVTGRSFHFDLNHAPGKAPHIGAQYSKPMFGLTRKAKQGRDFELDN